MEVALLTMSKYQLLEKELPNGEVLFPGSTAYQKAVFIGNLLYRFLVPACVVMAQTKEDVQTTVRFAKKHQIKLTVKNGGHSYAGFCLNEGGVVLDMSRMNRVAINDENDTITMQGGLLWQDAYALLKGRDLQNIIIGGQCPTVGVSGFTLGGGLSPFSRSYGLAIDGLLEMTIVTAKGELITVSDQDTDPAKRNLFWAVRGGGGGNFGITVEMKSQIHKLPHPTVVCGELTWQLPAQEEDFKQAMNAFNTMTCPDELTVDAIWSYDKADQLTAQMTVIYNGTMEECDRAIAPITAYKPLNQLKAMHWTEWEKEEEGFDVFSNIYHHHASFVFGEGSITQEVTDKILNLMQQSQSIFGCDDKTKPNTNKCHILWDHVGGAASRIAPQDTAYFWRDGVYVMTVKVQWNTPELQQAAFDFVASCQQELTPHALQKKAAYLNYIDGTLQNWQQAYYGDNYPRLQQVKSHWDPSNFFYFDQSIELVDNSKPRLIWQNWSQSVTAIPEQLYRPTEINEVIAIVNQARNAGKTIRVVGAGHSWSPLVPSNDILISMENFTTIEVADNQKTVTIGSGVTVDQLSVVLTTNNICLPSDVGHGVGEATYGGIVSTGCHGSGITMHSTSDYVASIEVITSGGTIRTFTEADGDVMDAARLSLGMFGIITKLSFHVQPAYNVEVVEFKSSIDACLNGIQDFVLNNDYAEVSWIPFNEEVYMQKANKTLLPVTRVGTNPSSTPFDAVLNANITATALSALETNPAQTPDILRAGFRLMPLYNYVSNITDYLHNADYRSILSYKVLDIELAFETDESFNAVRKAFLCSKERVESWQAAGLFPFNGSLGFRFIRNSAAVLSQAKGNTYTALLEFSSFSKTDLFQRFAGELVQDLLAELPNARPHWAKGFQYMPQAVEYVRQSFKTQLTTFNQLKQQADVDPEGLFMNDYLKLIFRE